jgi:replication factor C subunit 2/4
LYYVRVEKYRPRALNDVSHQEEVVSTLRKSLQTNNLPHLLLYGPAGTGKTSTILAVARELYGPDLMKKRVLELNASSDRGIDVIRHRVKEFASVAVSSREIENGYPCPNYKIIILDEADSMTKDAQSALRRIMEQYTKVTRFCIICNYVSRIIDPITSRCAKFRYKPIEQGAMVKRLNYISTSEHISFENPERQEEILNQLVDISAGDMRKAITLLQTAAKFSKSSVLTLEVLREISGVVPAEIITQLYSSTQKNSFSAIEMAAKQAILSGYPVDLISQGLIECVLNDSSLSDEKKGLISIKIAENELRLIEGSDEFLQLLDILSTTAQFVAKN